MLHRNSAQRGLSFIVLLFIVGVLACALLVGFQAFPSVVEYQAIQKAAAKSTGGNTVAEVRSTFDKAAAVDDIKSITGRDLEVSKEGDVVVVKYAYPKEIHLAGPAYLLIKYAGSARSK